MSEGKDKTKPKQIKQKKKKTKQKNNFVLTKKKKKRVSVSVLGCSSSLVEALQSFVRFFPSDVVVKEIHPDLNRLQNAAVLCLKSEIELLLSNEAGKPKMVLMAQANSDEAICRLQESTCKACN